ncbi:MAG: NigD-like C-terminal domain-containing protein [Rikenellaceae bacterium]
MKHNFLFAALLASLTFVSCNDNQEREPGSYADKGAFASLKVVESLEDAEENVYYFVLDNGTKVFLADNPIGAKLDEANDERVVIYYALIEDYSEAESETLPGASYDCEYGLRLFNIKRVFVSESATVNTEKESEAIADHALSYVYDSFTYSNGYINLLAGMKADKIDEVKLYLVENLSEEPDQTDEDYLNLELRYDRATDESMGYTYEEFASLSLEQFQDQLADKKGVMLRMITLKSGTTFVKIDIENDQTESRTLSRTKSADQL